MLRRHHESTQSLEYKHQAVLQKMKDEQLRRQHETERENQTDYNQCAEAELRKKHNMEVKQQPRSLRVSYWSRLSDFVVIYCVTVYMVIIVLCLSSPEGFHQVRV